MALVEFKDVTRIYTSGDHIQKALDGANFTLDEGKFVVILGPSGAGKSTLLNMLGGLDSPTSGTITVNGKDISTLTNNELADYRASTVGFVFQFYNLIPTLTVYENVAFAQRVIGESNRTIKKNVPAMLSMVGLAAKYRSFPRQLSGGEQQRVAIARALINEPHILLADEPTGNLDNNNAWETMKLLEEINGKGTTVIVVTHNMEIVKAMNKRVITINKGVVVSDEKGGSEDEV